MATILVVDDRDFDRQYLCSLLASAGHRIIEAADGLSAASLVETEVPDLVVTDVFMPRVDGFELIQRMRDSRFGKCIAVILYTAAYDEQPVRSLAENCTAATILAKPCEPEVMLCTVSRVLSKVIQGNHTLSKDFPAAHLELVTTTLHERSLDIERTAAELSKAEAYLSKALLLAGVATWCWDAINARLTWSGPVRTVFGRSAEDLNSFKALSGIIYTEDLDRFRGAIEEAKTKLGEYRVEFRIVLPDASVRWIASQGGAFFHDDNTTLICGANFDITEKKATEQRLNAFLLQQTLELHDVDERYRILVDSVKDYSILMLDQNGNVASWTAAAERIKGYRADEILGKSFECLYTQPDRERGHPRDVLRKASLEGRFEEDGWRVRKDGSRFWANVVVTAVYDDSGQLSGFSKVTRDISRRRISELQLKRSEEKFRVLLECAPDAIVIADERGQIQLANAQAETLFGYERQELVENPVEMLIPASLRPSHEQHRAHFRYSPRMRQMGSGMELMGLRKDGGQFPVEVSLSPIQMHEGIWVAAGIRDITDRKEAEKRLIAERRLAEDANRSKSDFLATMSHEIRTPMNSILGLADLLWETGLDDLQRDYVGRFRRAGINLLTLINDILDLSKIESGRFELEAIKFNLVDVLNRVVELMAPRASVKNIELLTDVRPGTPMSLVGDPVRLQQIINNLVGNAIKFTHSGRITLAVTPDSDRQAGHLCFSVRDTGIGIPVEKVSAIFEAFIQAESSTTRRFGGTGLGLAICRHLVQRMGGDISVESVVGQGSIFTFDVLLSIADEIVIPKDETCTDLVGRRVLIVDDNSTNRFILAEMCTNWGMVVVEAGGAGAAFEVVRNHAHSPDALSLVLLDDVMPEVNGFEALETLARIDPILPIILMSSDRRPGDVTKANRLGAVNYVVKPVSKPELLRLVSAAVRGKEVKPTHPTAMSRERIAADRHARRPMKILLAEDSEDNRFLFAAYLQDQPYELTIVENGQQAVEMFRKQTFDLVLIDIQMPVLDGLTATAQIRSFGTENSAASVPILALTADARAEDAERSRAAGCTGHLTKPISKERLVASIEEFLGVMRNQQTQSTEASTNKVRREIMIPEGLQQLSRNYIAARRRDIFKMLQFLPGEDLEQLRVFGHNMKGSGKAFGFSELANLGAAIEMAAKASDAEGLANSLTKAKDYIDFASKTLQ